MASFQDSIRTFINDKLNNATNNPLVQSGTTFKLYNRYEVEDQDFYDFVLDSIDWNTEGSTGVPANNVVVEYEDKEHNTQLGQYTLEQVEYIPCILEAFTGEFQPLEFVRNVSYTIPLTFYINETFNRKLENKIIEAVEIFQDKIRGKIELIYNHSVLINHSDITPLTGIIDFNGTIFREYQVILYMDAIQTILPTKETQPFFGNQIEYRLKIDGVLLLNNVPQKFRVYPVAVNSVRSNEIHMFQKFSTTETNEYEMQSIPNESAFTIELTFLYTGDSFTKFLYQQRYEQEELRKVTLEVKYPAMVGDTQYPVEKDFIIESIGGSESVGEKILLTMVLRPVSDIYTVDYVPEVEEPTEPIEPEEPTEPEEPVSPPLESSTLTVTVQNVGGTNVYFIDGVEKPELSLLTNNIYVFDQSHTSNTNHPIAFKDLSSAQLPYTQGVVSTGTPGTAGAKTTFTVPPNVPSILRYYCTVHGNAMGNTITFTFGGL